MAEELSARSWSEGVQLHPSYEDEVSDEYMPVIWNLSCGVSAAANF